MRVQAVVAIAEFRRRSLLNWCERLERARWTFGARQLTGSITEGEWLAHWRAGLDPASAVVSELSATD
jgi:hypothetical protein